MITLVSPRTPIPMRPARSGSWARVLGCTVRTSALLALLVACGHSSSPSPFVPRDSGASGAGGAADGGGGSAGESDAATPVDAGANVGGPCVDDGQCDDHIACTLDHCDLSIERCRFEPDDTLCADDRYCNGVEVCDLKAGCSAGGPVTCSDSNVCTIDSCVEATHECNHVLRDADADGDPVWNCGGGDCNDVDPRVSSLAKEICANQIDDDCDESKDEAPCSTPQHDTCTEPLEITQSGTYTVSTVAATGDYALSCVSGGGGWRDVVAAIVVPQGPPLDVDAIARVPAGEVALASAAQCGDASTEIGCVRSYPLPDGTAGARLILHGLAPGAVPLYVFSNTDATASLKVEFSSATSAPSNETCNSALTLPEGSNVQLSLAEAKPDLTTACGAASGDLVYRFHLDVPRDVHVYATSLLGLGGPVVSLLTDVCATANASSDDEVTCRTGENVDLFVRALPAGDHYVSIASSGPDDVDLRLETSAPTAAPADDTCATAPALPLATTTDVPLASHTDAFQTGCSIGTVDAAYRLDLAQASDVLLIGRIAPTDTGAVALATSACASLDDTLACSRSSLSPIRTSQRGLDAGEYRAVVESASGTAMQLTALVRPATLPLLVAFADGCTDAIEIRPPGGFFQGSTANARADYAAGCDLGGLSPAGGRDQMLELTLDRTQRVILDMRGSSYTTLLDVRRGPGCPGDEVLLGCSAGYLPDRSYVDLVLQPGQYFVQIDGYAEDSGSWVLDAYVIDP
jgi:hypothetical protein